MLQLPNHQLDGTSLRWLRTWQDQVDAEPDFPKLNAKAKSMFSSKNRTSNATFRKVRAALADMCAGARRCSYCEDSLGDEVEHIYPKDIYPDKVFSWENYCYACGPCNGPKNNKFAIFKHSDGTEVDVTPIRGTRNNPAPPPTPPPSGDALLIDPRVESALELLFLDLAGTYHFLPMPGLSAKDTRRANYTAELLRLNDRDYLIDSRRSAHAGFLALLKVYVVEKQAPNPSGDLEQRTIEAIRGQPHRTVWMEMIRQQRHYPELHAAFDAAPEALTWLDGSPAPLV